MRRARIGPSFLPQCCYGHASLPSKAPCRPTAARIGPASWACRRGTSTASASYQMPSLGAAISPRASTLQGSSVCRSGWWAAAPARALPPQQSRLARSLGRNVPGSKRLRYAEGPRRWLESSRRVADTCRARPESRQMDAPIRAEGSSGSANGIESLVRGSGRYWVPPTGPAPRDHPHTHNGRPVTRVCRQTCR